MPETFRHGHQHQPRRTVVGTEEESVYVLCIGDQHIATADGRTDQRLRHTVEEPDAEGDCVGHER